MFTLVGAGTATVLASRTFLGVNYTIGERSSAFMQWGWRLHKAPLVEVLRLQRREIALAAGSVLGCCSFNCMAGTYAHIDLGYSRNVILVVGVLGGIASAAFVALSASLCDRVGRRRMMFVGWAACLSWSFVVIPLIDTGKPAVYAAAMICMQAVASIAFGPIPAFVPELFAIRYRYSATVLAVNVASVGGGAVPPLIAGALQATYGGWAIGLMLASVVAVSPVCTYLLPTTVGTLRSSSSWLTDPPVEVRKTL